MKLDFKNKNSYISTIMGIIVALANAWITIDWITFDLTKEYPKLILSGLIAIGGYKTTLLNNDK